LALAYAIAAFLLQWLSGISEKCFTIPCRKQALNYQMYRVCAMHWVFQSDNPHGNVVFNFGRNPINDLAPFAKGYHLAGKRLAKMLEDSYADYDGYPILFLYRHALELYMKAIIYQGAQLLVLRDLEPPNMSRLFSDHHLSTFLPRIKIIFDRIGWTWDNEIAGISSYEEFKDLIEGIEELDDDSYCFRYPTDTKGKEALNHHTIVNAIGFSHNMDQILDLLEAAITGINAEFDAVAEHAAEYKEDTYI
jgi:hypothetical protein